MKERVTLNPSNNRSYLPYFPPEGTKHKWSAKALQHYPHISRVEFLGNIFYAIMYCDAFSDGFIAIANCYSPRISSRVSGLHTELKTKKYPAELDALLAIEARVDKWANKIIKPWMSEAFKEGWRPYFRPSILANNTNDPLARQRDARMVTETELLEIKRWEKTNG